MINELVLICCQLISICISKFYIKIYINVLWFFVVTLVVYPNYNTPNHKLCSRAMNSCNSVHVPYQLNILFLAMVFIMRWFTILKNQIFKCFVIWLWSCSHISWTMVYERLLQKTSADESYLKKYSWAKMSKS